MNPPAGKPRARRPRPAKPVQLNLRRTPTWPEEDELKENPDGHFWRWFGIVAVLHLIAFVVLFLIFHSRTQPQPEFISLMPQGETVKGQPGPAMARKVAPTLPAPSQPAAVPTPPPAPPQQPIQKIQPPTPKPLPLIKPVAPVQALPPKPKPKPPAPPKVKVDLTLADAPDTDEPPPPKPKAKTHPKKPVHKTADADSSETTPGLSKEEVAQKLGDQFKDSGTEQAEKTGVSGAAHVKASDFSDFYQSIHDQVMNKWTVPNAVDETAVDPIVQIHVDKDGGVPPDRVRLLRSSNNPAFDQSALEAARGMGNTLQPLPDGCPPDISITFNLRQQ